MSDDTYRKIAIHLDVDADTDGEQDEIGIRLADSVLAHTEVIAVSVEFDRNTYRVETE